MLIKLPKTEAVKKSKAPAGESPSLENEIVATLKKSIKSKKGNIKINKMKAIGIKSPP